MDKALTPDSPDQVLDAVSQALDQDRPLEVLGNGSKRTLGRPINGAQLLVLSRLEGIIDYEPEELVMSALTGTGLDEITAALRGHGQHLAFEPPDLAALLGTPRTATIGGVFACNLSGPRRIKAGAARDHLLGASAVSGRAEAFKCGGRVVKNVTGYDMCKLLTGSYGTLAVMTEVTFKTLPAPNEAHTVLIRGLDDRAAIIAMTRALAGPWEVSGAAHLPRAVAAASKVAELADGGAATLLRVEGPKPSAADRAKGLGEGLGDLGTIAGLAGDDALAVWREIGDAAFFDGGEGRQLWRLSLPPGAGAEVVDVLTITQECRAIYDWGGGLVWLELLDPGSESPDAVRAAVAASGGHATLIRADAETRARVAVFQPQPPPLARLTARIKENFDPKGILNPGHMYDGV